MPKFEGGFLDYVSKNYKEIIESIEKEKKLDQAMEEQLEDLVEEYKGLFKSDLPGGHR